MGSKNDHLMYIQGEKGTLKRPGLKARGGDWCSCVKPGTCPERRGEGVSKRGLGYKGLYISDTAKEGWLLGYARDRGYSKQAILLEIRGGPKKYRCVSVGLTTGEVGCFLQQGEGNQSKKPSF